MEQFEIYNILSFTTKMKIYWTETFIYTTTSSLLTVEEYNSIFYLFFIAYFIGILDYLWMDEDANYIAYRFFLLFRDILIWNQKNIFVSYFQNNTLVLVPFSIYAQGVGGSFFDPSDEIFSYLDEDIEKMSEEYNIKDEDQSFALTLIIATSSTIFFENFEGLFPYSSCVTSHLFVTLTLSCSYFLAINIMGISLHGEKMFTLFLPQNTPTLIGIFLVPIELLSYSSRMFSLAIRLFANVVASHILTKILLGFVNNLLVAAGLLNIFLFICFHFFFLMELGIAFLQVYIYTILSILYLRDALYPLH